MITRGPRLTPRLGHIAGTSTKTSLMLKSFVRSSLAGVLILLPFPNATEAQAISLTPNTIATACETITIGWPLAHAHVYNIQIIDSYDQHTAFQTAVHSPTSSIEWLVHATGGASLHLVIVDPFNSIRHSLSTDFQVQSSSTNCAASIPSVRCILLYSSGMKLSDSSNVLPTLASQRSFGPVGPISGHHTASPYNYNLSSIVFSNGDDILDGDALNNSAAANRGGNDSTYIFAAALTRDFLWIVYLDIPVSWCGL